MNVKLFKGICNYIESVTIVMGNYNAVVFVMKDGHYHSEQDTLSRWYAEYIIYIAMKFTPSLQILPEMTVVCVDVVYDDKTIRYLKKNPRAYDKGMAIPEEWEYQSLRGKESYKEVCREALREDPQQVNKVRQPDHMAKMREAKRLKDNSEERVEIASRWLSNRLEENDGRERPAVIKTESRRLGILDKHLSAARKQLNIITMHHANKWYWVLPSASNQCVTVESESLPIGLKEIRPEPVSPPYEFQSY